MTRERITMEIINKTKIASADIAEVRVSSDELQVYETALTKLLETISEADALTSFGATKDELEGIRDDVREVLFACGKTEKIMALT